MTAAPVADDARGPTATAARAGLGALVTGLHGVASAAGLEHLVSALVAECSRPAAAAGARVVVVGAAKRGKSALVNAVLGRPDLLPVDTDVATGVHVAVRHGDREHATLHRAGLEPTEIGLDDVARYASERHNPGNVEHVLAVEIHIAAPVLAGGLELVDTPGVDSVVARHADVTLAALGLADALVLVVDPTRPLTAPELAFLRRATRRIGRVVFALTKTDAHPEWRRVLDDDRALVAEHAARFASAPFVAVSARLKTVADRAREQGRDRVADRVEAESNTAALAAELSRVAEDIERVRLGNVVQHSLVVLSRLHASLRAARPTADPEHAARVEADRAALRRIADGGARWRPELAHGFRRLQLDLETQLAQAATRADHAMADSLATWRTERADTLGRELDDAVRVLWLEAATFVRERVETLVRDMIDTVAEQGVEVARPELALPVLEREATRRPDPEDDPTTRGLAGAVGSYGAAVGLAFGAERLLVPLGLLVGAGGLGIGAALGLAGIALRRRGMQRVREQRAAQRLASRTLIEARQHTQREFVKHLVDVQHGLETTVADLLAQRRRDLDAAVATGEAALRRSSQERAEQRRVLDDRIATVEGLTSDAAALHRMLATAHSAATTTT